MIFLIWISNDETILRLASVIQASSSFAGWKHADLQGLSCITASFTPSLAAWWRRRRDTTTTATPWVTAWRGARRWHLDVVCSRAQWDGWNRARAWLCNTSKIRGKKLSTLTWMIVCRLLPGRTCRGHLFWLAGFLRSTAQMEPSWELLLQELPGRSFLASVCDDCFADGRRESIMQIGGNTHHWYED